MSTTKSTFIAACLAASLAGGAYAYEELSMTPQEESDQLAFNRQWVDHLPQGGDDLANILIFADIQGQKIGVTADISEYRQHVDYTSWSKKGADTVSFFDLQERKKHTMRYKAYACDQEGFELCMDVKLDGKRKTYLSMRDWTVSVDHAHEINVVHLDAPGVSHD